MEDGKVVTLDETEVMEQAQAASDRMLDRNGLRHLLEPAGAFWGAAHATSPLPRAPRAPT
jgi:hypothetical protein